MRFNHEEIPEVEQDPMQQLMQMTDGCIVIGYEKDTRKNWHSSLRRTILQMPLPFLTHMSTIG